MLLDSRGESRPPAMAKADHADAYKQRPFGKEAGLAAAVTRKNLTDGLLYGFVRRTQHFGSAAAVLHYNCFSRAKAPLARRILKIPCAVYYDGARIVAPRCLFDLALEAFTELNEALWVAPKNRKSEAGAFLEFLGLGASSRDDGGNVMPKL